MICKYKINDPVILLSTINTHLPNNGVITKIKQTFEPNWEMREIFLYTIMMDNNEEYLFLDKSFILDIKRIREDKLESIGI